MAQEWLAKQRLQTQQSNRPPDLTGIDTRYLPADTAALLQGAKASMLPAKNPLLAQPEMALAGWPSLNANTLLNRSALLKSQFAAPLLGKQFLGSTHSAPLGAAAAPGTSGQFSGLGNAPAGNDAAALQRMLLVQEASRNLQTAKDALASFHQTQEVLKATPGASATDQLLALKSQQFAANSNPQQTDASLMTLASLSSVVGAPGVPRQFPL